MILWMGGTRLEDFGVAKSVVQRQAFIFSFGAAGILAELSLRTHQRMRPHDC